MKQNENKKFSDLYNTNSKFRKRVNKFLKGRENGK